MFEQILRVKLSNRKDAYAKFLCLHQNISPQVNKLMQFCHTQRPGNSFAKGRMIDVFKSSTSMLRNFNGEGRNFLRQLILIALNEAKTKLTLR